MGSKSKNITEFITDQDYEQYLLDITGNRYSFASSSNRRYNGVVEEGDYYQLMPIYKDDGFFDWYTSERPEDQFFVAKSDAVLKFVQYWVKWSAFKRDAL